MKKATPLLFLILTYLGGCMNKFETGSTISLTTLLNEMSQRDALTRYPDPEYKLFQASSWDRSEKSKEDKTTWFANKDYNNYIRIDSSQGRNQKRRKLQVIVSDNRHLVWHRDP